MENKETGILELETLKKRLQQRFNEEIKALDLSIEIHKRIFNNNGIAKVEDLKRGRKPSDNFIALKNDIVNLVASKNKSLNKDEIKSFLDPSKYGELKKDFETSVRKATHALNKDSRLICKGGRRYAKWYLPEWINEDGSIKDTNK